MKMGYIAPIPHYQYKQYQEREMKVNKHPFRFFPVQPSRALKNNREETVSDKMSTQTDSEQKTGMLSPKRKLQKNIIPHEILAKVTGKGTYFNEYV
ncbi:hypothetical protein ACQ0QQ_08190 [Lysinibacillus sphaericus]